MRQLKQNQRSTKEINKSPSIEQQTNLVFADITQPTNLISSDLTGRFPITSKWGNKYILIIHDYDSNAIFTEPLPSRAQNHLIQAFRTIHSIFDTMQSIIDTS